MLGHAGVSPLAQGAGKGGGELDLAVLFRKHGGKLVALHPLDRQQRRAIADIARCRTAALGGHLHLCPDCNFSTPVYNSCRNRHCPKCQALAQGRWIAARAERLLPIGAFHIVFTVPDSLRLLARDDPEQVYAILMRSAGRALCDLAADPRFFGGQIAVTTVLHTWTRDLHHHPHVHCIVPAGALHTTSERWIPSHQRFFLPLAVLSDRFRTLVLAQLRRLAEREILCSRLGPLDLARRLGHLRSVRWHTYAKRSFGSPLHILHYLGRYTHRVAISNARLVGIDHSRITFRTRGSKSVSLQHHEFLRRFLLHILPHGFHKIRHFGLFSPAHSKTLLPLAERCIREQALAIDIVPLCANPHSSTGSDDHDDDRSPGASTTQTDSSPQPPPPPWVELLRKLTGRNPTRCPNCGGQLRLLPLSDSRLSARGPP